MEVLLRAEDEAQELKLQVEKAELETSKMRQNLAESWVTDAADGLIGDEMEHLEEMERNLRWLMKTQQAADNERQLVERLERKEGTLQKRLREVSEEKATLASARVDLGDAGKAMRETMASQSEGYVRQLTGLEEARRIAFSERVKLMQDWDGGYWWLMAGLWMAYGWLMDGLWMAYGWLMDGLGYSLDVLSTALSSRKCSHSCNHLPRSGSPLF